MTHHAQGISRLHVELLFVEVVVNKHRVKRDPADQGQELGEGGQLTIPHKGPCRAEADGNLIVFGVVEIVAVVEDRLTEVARLFRVVLLRMKNYE